MFGFGKKKVVNSPSQSGAENTQVAVIPSAFYGGADPVIHYASEASKKGNAVPAQALDLTSKSGVPSRPATHLAGRKKFIISAIVCFALFLLATSWYYVSQQKRVALTPIGPLTPVTLPSPNIVAVTTTNQLPNIGNATTTSSTAVTTTSTPSAFPHLVSERLGEFSLLESTDAADFDADQLTDREEDVFGTDPGVWDTDGDGYPDGLEVMNLYDPRGKAPAKLVDSGLVHEFVSPVWQYRLYYPSTWEMALVDSGGNDTIFSAVSGDFIEVKVMPKEPQESFVDWFARTITNQQFSDLASSTNRFQIVGFKRKDQLVAYYPMQSIVYVIIYHPAEPGPISFRHIMTLLTQSFRTNTVSADLPTQMTLPKEGGTTSSAFF